MKINITLNEQDIRDILAEYINSQYGTDFTWQQLPIKVKSKQNYKSEWEEAEIKIDTEIVSTRNR
jgi:hypothetical protein